MRHLEAAAPARGLELGLTPPPFLRSTVTPRPHVPPAALASLFGPGAGVPGAASSLCSGRSPNSPRIFLLFFCCCRALGTLLSPPAAGEVVWGASRISPHPCASSDPPPLPPRWSPLRWGPSWATVPSGSSIWSGRTQVWHPEPPCTSRWSQWWWLLGPLLTWDLVVDQNLKAHPCPLPWRAPKGLGLDGAGITGSCVGRAGGGCSSLGHRSQTGQW